MNELKVFEKNGQLLTDSREVAKMIGKEHFHLMRDISSYMKVLNGIETEDSDESKIGFVKNSRLKIKPSDFFLESTYLDGKGEIRPCCLLTKKGCDMVANKLTGQRVYCSPPPMSPPLNRCESVLKPAKHSQTTNPASSAPVQWP